MNIISNYQEFYFLLTKTGSKTLNISKTLAQTKNEME
jgi:hypothetical protein